VDERADVILDIYPIWTDCPTDYSFLEVNAVLGTLFVFAVGGLIAELNSLLRVVPVADAKFGEKLFYLR